MIDIHIFPYHSFFQNKKVCVELKLGRIFENTKHVADTISTIRRINHEKEKEKKVISNRYVSHFICLIVFKLNLKNKTLHDYTMTIVPPFHYKS